MAHIHRLICVFFSFLSASVWASFPATSGYEYSVTYNGYTTAWLGSAASACASAASMNSVSGFVYSVTGSTESSCSFSFTYNGAGPYAATGSTVNRRGALTCPANSTLSGDTCTCSSGYNQSGSTCVAPPPVNNCPSSGTVGDWFTGAGGTGTYTFCDMGTASGDPSKSGCVITIQADFAAPDASGQMTWGGRAVFGGGKCDGSGTGNEPAGNNPSPCPPGQLSGTINGSTVCYKPGTATQQGPTETSTTPSSGGGGPGAAPPGSTSSETSTTCSGGQCTTTTTWHAADGSVTGTSTKTQSQNDFCADNPKSLMCIQSSWAGGSCDSVPACDGDPVFCAIAQSDFKTKCALNPDPGPESELYHSEKNKTGSVIGDLPGSSTATIGAGSFDQTERFSASGLSDLSITVAGRPVTLQISVLNPWLVWMGNLLVAVSFLAAMAIVFKGQN